LCNLLLPSFRAIEFHNKEERKERTEPIELEKSSSSSSSAVVTAAGRGESISSFSLPLVDARSANRRLVHIFTEPTHASSSRHHQTQTPTNKNKKKNKKKKFPLTSTICFFPPSPSPPPPPPPSSSSSPSSPHHGYLSVMLAAN
jgi:hypothetical protein